MRRHEVLLFVLSWFWSTIALDPYIILGVSKGTSDPFDDLSAATRALGATQEEIKKAYRSKAKETHPDKNPGLPAVFRCP
jgi:curved DNA-binding protein CbpA